MLRSLFWNGSVFVLMLATWRVAHLNDHQLICVGAAIAAANVWGYAEHLFRTER